MSKNIFKNITLGQVFFVILFAFIFIQVIAKLGSNWFPSWDLRLGFVFQLIVVGFGITLMYMFIVKKRAELEKKDVLVLLLFIGILIAIFFALPKFMPEIFSITFPHANEQIQSFGGNLQSIMGGT